VGGVNEYRLHGPPGTGKTRSLATSWVPRAAEKYGAERVVICSLTKTAAAEIGSRLWTIPRENVGTLHALAYRSLGRPTIAEGELDLWNEEEPVFRLSGARASADEPEVQGGRGTKGDELMSLAQVYRHKQTPRHEWRHDVQLFQHKWEGWMNAQGMIDFTGLIEDAIAAVEVAPNDPAAFVVDEAQDCSSLELGLVRKWARSAESLTLAGDGDQAIYGWRGASVRAFLDPKIPTANNFHLTQSYRVPEAVHAIASKMIKRASYRYAVEYKPKDEEGKVEAISCTGRNPRALVRAAEADANKGESVMILASCGYMLNGVIRLLREEGIPFHNPYRPTHGGWNPLRGGAGRLLAYLKPDKEANPFGEDRLWTWKELQAWTDVIHSKGALKRAGKAWARKMGSHEEFGLQVMGEGDVDRVFGDAWQGLINAFTEGKSLDWLEQRLLASKRRSMEYPLLVARKNGVTDLQEEPLICVGSIHSVKGGEADNVYLLPDLSPSGMREYTRPDGRDSLIRTFYVGMTRARKRLVLAGRWSSSAMNWNG
tara:strand:+ start:557 stop:2179 length:1623 start_codon:yes stop_codon:yes gene_type:complete